MVLDLPSSFVYLPHNFASLALDEHASTKSNNYNSKGTRSRTVFIYVFQVSIQTGILLLSGRVYSSTSRLSRKERHRVHRLLEDTDKGKVSGTLGS